MTRLRHCPLALALVPLIGSAAPAASGDPGGAATLHQLELDSAREVQEKVLDLLLGPGRASVFVSLEVELKEKRSSNNRAGEGRATRTTGNWEAPRSSTEAASPEEPLFTGEAEDDMGGFAAAAKSAGAGGSGSRSTSTQSQLARQEKSEVSSSTTLSLQRSTWRLRILHDAALPRERLDETRRVLRELLGPALKPEDLVLIPARWPQR